MRSVLRELAGLALYEDWTYPDQTSGDSLPILSNYITQTFARLWFEDKIAINTEAGIAAFHTGLVDDRYRDIYAVFSRNPQFDPVRAQDEENALTSNGTDARGKQVNWYSLEWKLDGFCVPGESELGRRLMRSFSSLPERAQYYEDINELIYDIRLGDPVGSYSHILIDRIYRFPREFLEQYGPHDFEYRDPSSMSPYERKEYYANLRERILNDDDVRLRMEEQLDKAIGLAMKRVRWNFRTAVPQYFPTTKAIQLMLPLCLMDDSRIDLVLVVEKTKANIYLANTVLSLRTAYNNARLISPPMSDWLTPERITGAALDDED